MLFVLGLTECNSDKKIDFFFRLLVHQHEEPINGQACHLMCGLVCLKLRHLIFNYRLGNLLFQVVNKVVILLFCNDYGPCVT